MLAGASDQQSGTWPTTIGAISGGAWGFMPLQSLKWGGKNPPNVPGPGQNWNGWWAPLKSNYPAPVVNPLLPPPQPITSQYGVVAPASWRTSDFASDRQRTFRFTSYSIYNSGKMNDNKYTSASTVRKKSKYNVRDAFKFQKTVGGSNEHCCVPLCTESSRYNSEISFHRLPKDLVLRARWLHKLLTISPVPWSLPDTESNIKLIQLT